MTLFPGFAFAQLSVATDAAGLQENQDYDIRAVYSGSTNTFGGPSDPVSIHVDPHIEDTCNGLDDNGDGRVDENCIIVGDSPGGIQVTTEDAGAGTILSGVTLSGLPSDVNALGQMTYRAGPNAPISTSIDATRQATSDGTDPFCANCTRQVYVGVSGNTAFTPPVSPDGPICELDESLNDFPSTGTSKATFTNNILLTPPQPGLYYLRATSSLQSGCGQPDVGPPDKSIARIAVKGPTKTDNIQVTRPPKPGDPAPTTTKLGDHVTLAAQVEYLANNKVQVTGNVAFCDGGSNFTNVDPCGGGRLLQTVPLTTVMVGNVPTRQAVLDLDTACLFDTVCTGMPTATVPPVGDHTITAHLLDGGAYPNEFYIFSNSTPLTLHVDAAETNATLTLSSPSVTLGDHMAFNVAIGPGTFGPFGGTVYFCDTSAVVSPATGVCGVARELGNAPVSGPDVGVGALPAFDTANFYGPPLVALGDHAIIAKYVGANNYGDSTSPSQTVRVDPIPATVQVSVLDTNGNPAGPQPLGSLVTLKADLGPTSSGSGRFGSFTGQVHFKVDGNEVIGSPVCVTTPPTSVSLQLNTAALYGATGGAAAVGPHSVTANYERNTACGASAGNYASSTNASAQFALTASQTTTTITSSTPVDPRVSDSFTVAALVAGGSFGDIGGSVEFREVSTVLCTGRVSGDPTNGYRASCTVDAEDFVAPLIRGDHSITAYYLGDGNNYAPSTSAPQTGINVRQATTSVSFTTPSTAQLGVPTNLTATVSATGNFGPFSGTVEFSDGTSTIASAPINADGSVSAAIDWSALPPPLVATHSLTANYIGPDSGNYASGVSGTSDIAVTPADVTLLLSANPPTVVGSQSVTFTVSASGLFGSPTGAVTLKDAAGITVGTGNLASNGVNQSLVAISTTLTASATVTAHLAQTDPYIAQASNSVSVTVVSPTITMLTAPAIVVSPNDAHLSVTVNCPSCATGTPSGNVVIVVNGTPLATDITVSGGSGSHDYATGGSPWVAGANTVIARYQGGTGLAPSDSAVATVNLLMPTVTAVAAVDGCSPAGTNTVVAPCPATLNVTVTCPSCSGSPSFNGLSVKFKLNGTELVATAVLAADGTGQSQGNYPSGSPWLFGANTLVAEFQGGGIFDASNSADTTVTIKSSVSTTITFDSPSPITVGASGNIVAHLTAAAFGSPTVNSGTVQFVDGGTNLGSPVAVSSGTATVPLDTLTVGSHTISAHYIGSGNFVSSVSGGETSSTMVVNPHATTTNITGPSTHAAGTFSITIHVACPSGCPASSRVTLRVDGGAPSTPSVLDASGNASVSVTLAVAGSPHSLIADFQSNDANYADSSDNATITIT